MDGGAAGGVGALCHHGGGELSATLLSQRILVPSLLQRYVPHLFRMRGDGLCMWVCARIQGGRGGGGRDRYQEVGWSLICAEGTCKTFNSAIPAGVFMMCTTVFLPTVWGASAGCRPSLWDQHFLCLHGHLIIDVTLPSHSLIFIQILDGCRRGAGQQPCHTGVGAPSAPAVPVGAELGGVAHAGRVANDPRLHRCCCRHG